MILLNTNSIQKITIELKKKKKNLENIFNHFSICRFVRSINVIFEQTDDWHKGLCISVCIGVKQGDRETERAND